MLTQLEFAKLQFYRSHLGPIPTPMQALDYALEAEQTCKDIGPHDPAWEHFKSKQTSYENYALLLEKQ